jgi:hypothetical protein
VRSRSVLRTCADFASWTLKIDSRSAELPRVSLVRIHCYGCANTVPVEEEAMSRGLARAGWALAGGETFCPSCASARKLSPVADAAAALQTDGSATAAVAATPATGVAGIGPQQSLEPFPVSSALGESRGSRAWRLMRASFSVLREDPQLLVFPAVSLALTLLLAGLSAAVSLPGSGAGGAGAARGTRDAVFIASIVVAYPITFVSLYCGVALAAVLAGRLDGEPLTAHDGWMAARERAGLIAAWTMLVCTVGVVLRVIERYVPLGGRILVALLQLSWALATMFAVPVLAYENLGPRETLERSKAIFKQRWGTQLGGIVGFSVASVFMFVPFIVLLVIGLGMSASSPAVGGVLIVLGGAGLLGVVAVQMALDQIFRVFVYRNAVGLDTSGGPFSQSDLQAPFARRRGR